MWLRGVNAPRTPNQLHLDRTIYAECVIATRVDAGSAIVIPLRMRVQELKNAEGVWCSYIINHSQWRSMSLTCVLLLSDMRHFHLLSHNPLLETVIRLDRNNMGL